MPCLVIISAAVLRYRADRQTNRQTPPKTLPPRLPSSWVIISRSDRIIALTSARNSPPLNHDTSAFDCVILFDVRIPTISLYLSIKNFLQDCQLNPVQHAVRNRLTLFSRFIHIYVQSLQSRFEMQNRLLMQKNCVFLSATC